MKDNIKFIKSKKLLSKLKKESIVISDFFIIIKIYLMDLNLEENTEYSLNIKSSSDPEDFFSLFNITLEVQGFKSKTYSNPDIFIKNDLNLIIIKDNDKYMIEEDLKC